jgi:hypothetical protein
MTQSMMTANFPKRGDRVTLDEARAEIQRRKLFLEDLERITGMRDTHPWGSDRSRNRRADILAEFERRVMADVTVLADFELREWAR